MQPRACPSFLWPAWSLPRHSAYAVTGGDERLGRFRRKEPGLDHSRQLADPCHDLRDIALRRNPHVEDAMPFVGDARLTIAKAKHRGQAHRRESLLDNLERERRQFDR